MSHQKSEDRVVPEGQRKLSPTQRDSSSGGGEAVPVEKVSPLQLQLFATAESPRPHRGTQPEHSADQSAERPIKVPKAKSTTLRPVAATLFEVVERLDEAFDKVEANRGAPGPDRQTVQAVR
jgi:hypothetical protein